MRILIICHYGLNESTPRAFRAKTIADALVEDGYNVDVLIGSERKLYENYQPHIIVDSGRSFKTKKRFKKIRIIGSQLADYLFGDMKTVKYYHVTRSLIKKKYDIILSIGLPFYVHMISAKMKDESTARIADCGDPFYYDGKNCCKHVKNVERNILNKMDYVTIPDQKALSYYGNFLDMDKIKIISQGVDVRKFKRSEYRKNKVPTFAYAGVFYETIRDPRIFLENLVNSKKDYRFVLYTDINDKFFNESIAPIIKQANDKIVVKDLISRTDCVYELSKMDFLINFDNVSNTQVPSKIIDYSITGRPVLSFSEKTFDANIFNKFLEGDYSDQFKINLSDYDIKNKIKQFEELFEVCKKK